MSAVIQKSLMSKTVSVDALRLCEQIRARGGHVLPHHEAELIALTLDNMCGRASYLYECIRRNKVPKTEQLREFLIGWRDESTDPVDDVATRERRKNGARHK